jgi:3'(2'), 5'-bisphosphate nucleotidase
MSGTLSDRADALARALVIARQAAAGIARIYAGDFDVEYKAKDDPVTLADREANALICAALMRDYPGVPIVAEESDPSTYAGFASAPAVWFVDPLDGTREFVAKNGEFAVMIGLAEAGRATLGVLVEPATGRAFVGAEGLGAFEVAGDDSRRTIHVSRTARLADAELLVSRSHRSASVEAAVAKLGVRLITPRGGAGVKAARVACGETDLYVQPGRAGKLWDACAPEAIVRAAGGQWSDALGGAIPYASDALENARGVVAANPALHAQAIERLHGA